MEDEATAEHILSGPGRSLEPIRKIISGENFDALGERGEGSKIDASVAVATLRKFWVLRRSYPRCIEICSQKDFSDRHLEPI